MRVRKKKDDESLLEVQMAPLIDCVFLLLIFFLVATTLKNVEPELQLRLPVSSAAVDASQDGNQFVISIDYTGAVYLEGRKVSKAALRQKVKEAAILPNVPRVRIDADRRTPYQYIVEVMDLCQFEGLYEVGMRMSKLKK